MWRGVRPAWERLLDAVELADRKDHKARTLSTGLRRRLMLCTALVTEPEVLFLDEPTSGLDVQSTRVIREIVRELNGRGLTVFLTTHNMDEADEMCSRVAIINEGRIAAIDVPERLRSAMRSSQYVEVGFADAAPPTAELEALPGVLKVSVEATGARLYSETPGPVAAAALRLADSKGLGISHLSTRKPSLEDVFLHITSETEQERRT